MNFEQARFNMIEQQLRPGKVLDPDVLDVLFVVKREEFVPPAHRRLSFADTQIPLGGAAGARMLAPIVEGHALQALAMKKHENVLEVGTGSGYIGVTNVAVEVGNGLEGLAAHAPYDAIMVSGAVAGPPEALLDQLKPGGRLFAIEGAAPAMEAVLYTRVGDDFRRVRGVRNRGSAPACRGARARVSPSENHAAAFRFPAQGMARRSARGPSPCCSTCASPGSSRPAASPVRYRCRCAASRRAIMSSAATADIVMVCHHGARSFQAGMFLEQMGFWASSTCTAALPPGPGCRSGDADVLI
jgi:protein-L-isoaspartate(D-aspartate) O-methyltransferase